MRRGGGGRHGKESGAGVPRCVQHKHTNNVQQKHKSVLADRTFPGETRSRVKVLRDGEAAETKAAAKQRGHRQRDRASFVVQALVEEKNASGTG